MQHAIYFSDLALRYFPRSTKRVATVQLKRWIRINTELKTRLEQLHYMPRQRVLTPSQHEALIRYLGEP